MPLQRKFCYKIFDIISNLACWQVLSCGDEADGVVWPVLAVQGDQLGLYPLLPLPAPGPVQGSDPRVSPGASLLVRNNGGLDNIEPKFS